MWKQWAFQSILAHVEQALGAETRMKVLRSPFHGDRTLDVPGLVLEAGKRRAGVYNFAGVEAEIARRRG
jgi:hypothetical protein